MGTSGISEARVLYLTYWGAAEPLGQSLVLPAVQKLAGSGARITLVTFEKPADLASDQLMGRIRSNLRDWGINWIPLRYHKRPKVPATAFDIAHGCLRGLSARLRGPFEIVHGRTYIGGLVGMMLARLIGVRFVFHNEGFYPDEQVDGGVWQANSLPHRVARTLEQRMYAAADGLIVLSDRARRVVEDMPAVRRRGTPVIVVPSCVNLKHFGSARAERPSDKLRLIYVGSIGYRYIFDRIARFVAAACRELGDVQLRVLTRIEPSVVEATLREAGVPEGVWSIGSVPHAAMPAELAGQHAGLFFLTQGLSEHGCSPTKIGEYWASGLPVVTTPNVSDTDAIVRRHGVGVIVREHSETEYRRAARELRSLLGDPELPRRCRLAAEMHYALDAACERQMVLYEAVLGRVGVWDGGKRTAVARVIA